MYVVPNRLTWDGKKDGLGIIGIEEPGKKYKKGNRYYSTYDYVKYSRSNKEGALAWGLGVSGGLFADDATVIGTIDDLLIPLVLGGTLVYVLVSDDYVGPLPITVATTGDPDDKVVAFIDGKRHPESARHAYNAIIAGYVNIGDIDRPGASARRSEHLKGIPTQPGVDRDEFLPAMLKPLGIDRVSVQYVPSSDNKGAGSSLRHQLTPYKDGTRVIVIPINIPANN